jgi:3-dehydroquinate synthase
MVIASMISVKVGNLDSAFTEQLKSLLCKYHLPVKMQINAAKAMEILKMDKKRTNESIDYILLEKPGQATIHTLPFKTIEEALIAYESNN